MGRLVAGTGLVLALAGCVDLHWVRADADAESTARDLQQCQMQAMLAAQRLSSLHPRNAPQVIRGPGGEGIVVMPAFPALQDPLLEMDFRALCMRDKGYALIERKAP